MPTARRGLPRASRLRRSREFRRVAQQGRRSANRRFVVVMAPKSEREEPGCPRLGLTVSRKVGGAVVRNHVKRRVREWFRASRTQLPKGVDLVVIARRGAGELSTAEVASSLARLAREVRSGGREPETRR